MRPRRSPPRVVAASLTVMAVAFTGMAVAACSTYDGAIQVVGRDASGDYMAKCQTTQLAQGASRGGDLRPAMYAECEQEIWVVAPDFLSDLYVSTKRAPCTERALDCGRVEATLVVRHDPAGDVLAISAGGTTKVLVRGTGGKLLDDRCSPSPSKDVKAALAAAPAFTTPARCP